MSRSGYSDQIDNWELIRWRGAVASSIKGKRGQEFLRELGAALDAMPEKRLIRGDLVDMDGEVCALGALGKVRGLDMKHIDASEPESVAKAFGIPRALAAEIEFINDEDFCYWRDSTPEKRWEWMRKWVSENIKQ